MRSWFISDIHFGHFNVIKYSNRPFLAQVAGNSIVANGQSFPISPDSALDKQIEYHSVKWMNETIIKNWNDSVKPKDKVYFLGDFAFTGMNSITNILSQLNGYKILIKGNHDRSIKQMLAGGFDEAYDSLTIKINDEQVLLSHYPYVDLDLTEAARYRPNILKFSEDKDIKLPTIPNDLDYQTGRDWLARFVRYPINTSLPESKDYIIKVQRMISRYIGSRPVNEGKVLLHGHTHSPQKRFANMINLSLEAWNYRPASEAEISQLIKEYKQEVAGELLSAASSSDKVYEYYARLEQKLRTGEFKEISDLSHLYKTLPISKCIMSVPRNYSKKWYDRAVALQGFIPMDKLVDGKFYTGSCRNAKWAYWDGVKQEFYYIRHKFGSDFVEPIQPVEKDDGFDLFIPHSEYEPTAAEVSLFWELK
jgi:calcineurin-like phosphoesterase family protein